MLRYPQRLHGEAQVSCLEEQLFSKRNAYAALRKENMEYEQDVEDCKIKISERYSIKAGIYNIPFLVLLYIVVGHLCELTITFLCDFCQREGSEADA